MSEAELPGHRQRRLMRKRPELWLFRLGMLLPVGIFLSYAFVLDFVQRWFFYIVWIHGALIVLSVLFCSAFKATNNLRRKIDVVMLIMALGIHSAIQIVLHLGALFVGWPMVMMCVGYWAD